MRFLVPEVVQTSAMDCGPAALKALLAGFGVRASYGRLREACQTDVDGTSIDTLEEIAAQLGLVADQVVIPVEHVALVGAAQLPAIVVVRLPNGFTHFVVAWRRVGPYVQLMDPAIGRRWVRHERFLADLFVHAMPVDAVTAADWLASDDFQHPLRRRLRHIGCAREGGDLLAQACGWRDIAALDAATRWTESVHASGALAKGRECAAALQHVYDDARRRGHDAVPAAHWTVTPLPPDESGEERVRLRGAVLVRIRGLRPTDEEAGDRPNPLSPELVRALEESPAQPVRAMLRHVGSDGASGSALRLAIGVAAAGAAAGTLLEAVLLRGVLDLGHHLGVVQQRFGAVTALLAFLAFLLVMDVGSALGIARIGRRLETSLRVAFLAKIPRIGDRYFASRPVSDMAERCHAGARVRVVPETATQALRVVMELVATVLGIAWLDPSGAPFAIVAAICAVGAPVVFLPALAERDLRMRTHDGALSRFYLDALLGLSPIRTHTAERSVAREHEALLVEWARAARDAVRVYVTAELVQSLVGTGVAVALLFRHVHGAGEPAGVLLLVYWSLAIPALGQELGFLLRQLPGHRNTMLRVLEPLGAPEEEEQGNGAATERERTRGASIRFDDVNVVAAGHSVLDAVSVEVADGEHVAIVGSSGAGKSTLLATLLGWHRPCGGRVLVDGVPLVPAMLAGLRAETAWVDPAVQLWNRSLVENLLYGTPADGPAHLGRAMDAAALASVLEKLPGGMQTALGEGGALVSGGEGQRVRLARGLLRHDARLVLLDEPFRGLDREKRHALLDRARAWWAEATLLCVTHDVGETLGFARVLVVEDGRIVEDGAPRELLAKDSRYRGMLEAEQSVLRTVWGEGSWRRVQIDGKRIVEARGSSGLGEGSA